MSNKSIVGLCVAAFVTTASAQTYVPNDVTPYYGGVAVSVIKIGGMAPSGTLSQLASFVASQLVANRNLKNVAESRIAVASFVDIENLGQSSQLGIQLAENLMHEMHVRGFSVVDFKMREGLKVASNGDFVFSRDLADLKREQNIHYYLSGTVSLNADGAVINARLVDADTSLISSTAQVFLPKRELHRLLNGEKAIVERPAVQALQPTKVLLK